MRGRSECRQLMGSRVELHKLRQDLSSAGSRWTVHTAPPEQPAWCCSAAHTMKQPTSKRPPSWWTGTRPAAAPPPAPALPQQQPLHPLCRSSSHRPRPPTTLAAMTSRSCAPLDTLLSTWQRRRVGSETNDEAKPGGMVARTEHTAVCAGSLAPSKTAAWRKVMEGRA